MKYFILGLISLFLICSCTYQPPDERFTLSFLESGIQELLEHKENTWGYLDICIRVDSLNPGAKAVSFDYCSRICELETRYIGSTNIHDVDCHVYSDFSDVYISLQNIFNLIPSSCDTLVEHVMVGLDEGCDLLAIFVFDDRKLYQITPNQITLTWDNMVKLTEPYGALDVAW